MSLTVKVARTFLSRGRGERSTLRRGRHDGLLAGMAVSRRIHGRVASDHALSRQARSGVAAAPLGRRTNG